MYTVVCYDFTNYFTFFMISLVAVTFVHVHTVIKRLINFTSSVVAYFVYIELQLRQVMNSDIFTQCLHFVM